MVVPLGPNKFYGRSLPRPRIYTNVKHSYERVDPPAPVMEPLLLWANEAHWSMGGLSFQRLRLQGKIEGNIQKLRKEQEKMLKKQPAASTPIFKSSKKMKKSARKSRDSPPAVPVTRKLRLRTRLIGGSDDEEEEVSLNDIQKGAEGRKRRRLVRKLGDDFEKVADQNGKGKGGGVSKRSPLKDVSNGGGDEIVISRSKAWTRRNMVLMEEEESEGYDLNAEAAIGENGKGKKRGEKGSVSPADRRSSPRLKSKSS